MSQTIQATFDGKVLRPEKPLAMRPNTRVRIVVLSPEAPLRKAVSFLKIAEKIQLEGPSDWSLHLDDYLYPSFGNKIS
ncbi:MAG: DUF104 domain-containing protein [Gammaproteobacteria bacterium]|nr:DUF104 domain-containing protein [Gammaproteobacteria bacterium]